MQKEIIIITIIAYFALMIGIGMWNRKSSKGIAEFAIGNRNASGWISAFAYGTSYFSAVMFIGYAGTTGWKFGIWAIMPGIGNAVFGSLLAWLVLANRTREITKRLEIKSMPQFFEKRFGGSFIKQFSVFIIFVFLIPYSASVYSGLSSVCNALLGIDENLCMIIIAAAAALIVLLGGYAATLKADFVQGLIMIFGIVMLIVIVTLSDKVGGLVNGIDKMIDYTKTMNLEAKDHLMLWATVLMTSFGTWGLPQMIHKFYTIKDKTHARRGVIISTVFALIVAGGGYMLGSFLHLFFTEIPEKGMNYLIPEMLLAAKLPDIMLGIVLVLLISASVSTLGAITITASSTMTMDFIQAKVKKNMPSKTAGLTAKIIAGIFIIVSYFIATTDTPILDMMSYSWGIISGSMMAAYVLSLYWKKLNKMGAYFGMIGGFIIASPPLICRLFAPEAVISLGKIADMGPHFACAAIILSFVLSIVGSLLGKRSENPALISEFYGLSGIAADGK